jgi:peptidoglycan/LPS O-acetylase OafA/YrhL
LSERLGHRPSLDGLRALAVSAVVLWHGTGYPVQGELGVDIFFVLSGFLITTLLLEEQATKGSVSFRSFYVRRARRLLPALLVMLAVFAAVETARGLTRQDVIGVAGGIGYCTNLLMGFNIGHPATALTPLWSLSLEEQFYLVWPVLLVLLLRADRRAAVGFLGLVVAATMYEAARLSDAGASAWRLAAAPDTRSVSLAIGCLCAIAFVSGKLSLSRKLLYRLEPFLFAFVLLMLTTFIVDRWFHEELILFFGLATALLLALTLERASPLGRALSLPPVAWLGRVSYSLYLWHLPVFVMFGIVGAHASDQTGWLTRVAAIAVALLVATGSYYIVERPFRRQQMPRIGLFARRPRWPLPLARISALARANAAGRGLG